MDHRNGIKFFVRNENKCASTFEMLTVTFGESTKTRTQVPLWYNWFKLGQANVNDDASQHPMKRLKQ